ncbi:MAG TPA: hypothetical protein PKB06_06310 [Actinotalea sp.]|nr:hypothetical protein [Actinotalea sp.]
MASFSVRRIELATQKPRPSENTSTTPICGTTSPRLSWDRPSLAASATVTPTVRATVNSTPNRVWSESIQIWVNAANIKKVPTGVNDTATVVPTTRMTR